MIKMMTKDEAIQEHRKMWQWMGNTALMQKRIVTKKEYMETHNIDNDLEGHCFCCEYCSQQGCRCTNNCILAWGSKVCVESNIFRDYMNFTTGDERRRARLNEHYKKFAHICECIATIPENDFFDPNKEVAS